MMVINRTKSQKMYFPHILKTTQEKEFIDAIIDRAYDGTEEWSKDDTYEFEETPDFEEEEDDEM